MDNLFKAEMVTGTINRNLIIAQEHGVEHYMHIHCVNRAHELLAELADHLGYDIVKREATE